MSNINSDKNTLKFEVLCIDNSDKVTFSNIERFKLNLFSSEDLCSSNCSIKSEENNSKYCSFYDEEKKLNWEIKQLDTGISASDYFSSAYIITISGEQDCVESIRQSLLIYLRDIKFTHRRILTDEVSQQIAVEIYPLIYQLENQLRRFIVKFFITKIGLKWWDIVVPSEVDKKYKMRKDKRKGVFDELANFDVQLIDFDELGVIAFQQKTAFTNIVTEQ